MRSKDRCRGALYKRVGFNRVVCLVVDTVKFFQK